MTGIENGQVRALAADQAIARARVLPLVRVALLKTGNDIARDAKIIGNAKFSNRATGATVNSISATMVNATTAEVGPTTYYAKFVEDGTSRMAPKPFMGPAAERHEPAFLQAVALIGMEGMGS